MRTQENKLKIFLLTLFAMFLVAGSLFCRREKTIAGADTFCNNSEANYTVQYSVVEGSFQYFNGNLIYRPWIYLSKNSANLDSNVQVANGNAVFLLTDSIYLKIRAAFKNTNVSGNYKLTLERIYNDNFSKNVGEELVIWNLLGDHVAQDINYRTPISGTEFDTGIYLELSEQTSAGGNAAYYPKNKVVIKLHAHTDDGAPTVTLSCADNGYEQNFVKVDYYDQFNPIGLFSREEGALFPNGGSQSFQSGTKFSEEGNYYVRVRDLYGNYTEKRFTVDRTAPTLELNNLSDGQAFPEITDNIAQNYISAKWDTESFGVGKQLSNKDDELTVKYGLSKSGYPTESDTGYTRNKRLEEEGYYRFEISDKAGNKSVYYAVLDKTAPAVTPPEEYINSSFVFSPTDPFGVRIEYKKDGRKVNFDGDILKISCEPQNYGIYEMRAVDKAGNYTQWYKVRLYYRDSFGNKDNIYNTFAVPYWYTVTLPQRIYPDIYGTYSFRDHSSAIAFAISKEWEYRVVSVSDGRYYYVNYSNENITQVYDDITALNAAVRKYAESYVSDRIIFSKSGRLPVSPMDNEGTPKSDALTEQNPILPSELGSYSALPKMFIRPKFAFMRPISGIDGNRSSVSMKLIHNGVTALNGAAVAIGYGESIESVLKNANAWQQGWYLVSEKDTCGNREEYLVFIDLAMPSVECETMNGNGNLQTIVIDEAYVEEHKNVMRYVKFDLKSVVDSDRFVFLSIEGRGLGNTYIYGEEELPCLTYENGYYGNYTITVYDRSLNIFSFTVRVAGAEPTLFHSSLENEIKCTLTIELGDSSNALTSVKLYKISYEGVYEEMQEDDDGTVVGPNASSYVLRTGGKYAMKFTDIFGRTIVTEPLFYMKGLPVGILSGVKAGGLTNRDVSIKYAADNSVILYAWKDGAWERADELHSVVTDEQNGVASIAASAETSYKFKYFLYVLADMNLFTEYYFEIDKIPPSAEIKTTDGETIPQDSVTRKDFFVTWSESGYSVRYYNAKNALGEFGAERYSGETIKVAGTYIFELTDQAKNILTFSVTLDNAVSWTLDSTEYARLSDGSYISKYNFTLTVNERTSFWEVTSSNGFTPLNGQKIVIDGTYTFHIADLYGNELILTLIIDNLPPVPVITAEDGTLLSDNTKTNKKFRVSCNEENVAIVYSFGGGAYAPYDGSLVDQEGIYTFRLSDRMNNRTVVSLEIELSIKFTVNGSYVLKDGNYYSKSWLSLVAQETFTAFEIIDELGQSRDPSARFDTEGKYFVYMEDLAGNRVEFQIVIDKSAPNVLLQNVKGKKLEEGTTVNLPFSVSSEEADVSITYRRGNTGNTIIYEGEILEGAGRYTFTVSDFLGNKREFEMRITYSVEFDVSGNYIEDGFGNYLSRSSITLTAREECVIFRIEHVSTGVSYGSGDKVAAEGTYDVTILSAHGNKANFQIVIDRAPPLITLEGVESNGATRENVRIIVSEGDSAFYRKNGSNENYSFVDSCVIEEEGAYTVMAKDAVGNSASVTFTIDKSVLVTPSISLFENRIFSEALSFTFGEPVTATLIRNDERMQYVRGAISEEGIYTLEVTDDVGNVSRYFWTLLKRRAREYNFEFNNELYVVSAMRDGAFENVVNGNRIELSQKGNYELLFEGKSGSFNLMLTVDNTVPTVTITQGKNNVQIDGVQKEGVTYKLFKDGKEVEFRQTITAVGDYHLILEDEIGNINEYDFSLHYLNAATIALIVIGCILIVSFIGVLLVLRLRQKIK